MSGPRSSPRRGRAGQRRRPEQDGLAARRAALVALRAVDEDDAWSNTAVPAAIAGLPDERDRAFASHLAYDTLRWEGTLDWALGTALTRPIADVEPALRRVLRLGALQLLRSGVPARAAVDTSVELAREVVPERRSDGAGGFVNGVLRGLSRGLDDLPWPDPVVDPVQHLVLQTAHPAWVVLDLLDRYPLDRVATILAADDEPPGLTLRASGDRGALIDELTAAGLDARRGHLPEAVRVPGADPRRLAAVEEGRAVPQDEASIEVVHAVGAQPGERVLDLCAGPGGKATHLATVVGTEGQVTAVELHPHRAQMVRAAAERLGVGIDVRVGDANVPPLDDGDRFDRVLVDAPCTGLGAGRRRPEVRWRRTPDDARDLAALQLRLLEGAATRVGEGGSLTYAVCTWTAAETVEVLERFATTAAAHGLVLRSSRQLLPDEDDTDGMFVATWEHTSGHGDLPGS